MPSSPFPSANAELDYPLYAVDFDPQDANCIIVGGGGGAGRSGVGNKISILETPNKDELRVTGEIDLSRDEDSVMSLAVGASKAKTTYVYAGVNSSPADIVKGKNEHLRTLAVERQKTRASSGSKIPEAKISELSRAALFTDPHADTYQRVLRVAGNMGVAASALGDHHQLAIFENIGTKLPKIRGILELTQEVEGLDIIDKGDGEYQVAYTTKTELYLINVGKENSEPEMVYTVPENETLKPEFKTIRYLTPNFVMAAANLGRNGGILQGLRLPSPGHPKARMAITARLPRDFATTSIAVANISPPASPSTPAGDTEFIIAAARADASISLYTLKHTALTNIDILSNLYPLYHLKDAHGGANISGLAFSPFTTPKTHIRQQFIKLASISLQKTVAVHSIALKKFVDKTPRNKKAPPRPVRYVVAMKSTGPSHRHVFVLITVVVTILAIVGQSLLEVYGKARPILHINKFFPPLHSTLRSAEHQPAYFQEHHDFLAKLTGDRKHRAGEKLVVWEADHPVIEVAESEEGPSEGGVKKIKVDVHDDDVHGPGKSWDELPTEQQDAWKDRLYDAGAWTQGMGESVFKGILFGELAGAVGRAVGG